MITDKLRKGQSTAEYAIVIGLVIAAALAMQTYVKRGLQGHVKDAVDYNDPDASGQFGVGTGSPQFEPDYETMENMQTTRDSTERTTSIADGGVERKIIGEEESSKGGKQTILPAP